MQAPITIEQLKDLIVGAKRCGFNEGRSAAVDAIQADYQRMGAEDKIYVTGLGARVLAIANPYDAIEIPKPDTAALMERGE